PPDHPAEAVVAWGESSLMQGIGRIFRPSAAAGGDLATAETDHDARASERLSADGQWWWDGDRWVPASTDDGLWEWDGVRWRPTIALHGTRPGDLATTLAFLAEDRYARAGAILFDHAREWQPAGEVRELLGRAAGVRRRLLGVGRTLAAGPVQGLLRRRDRVEDRERGEEGPILLGAWLRALLVRLGRLAPRPPVRAADELLLIARGLDHRAGRITEALAAADEAERARVRAIEAAGQELDAAEAARLHAVEAAAEELT